MVVAFGTTHRRAEPGPGYRANTVGGILGQILLRLCASLARHHVQAIKASGDELINSGMGKQIARDLFAGKLVEWHVAVERVDDIIAIGEDALILITMETDGVSKSNEI